VADYLQSSSAIFALARLNRYSKAVFIPILLRFNVSHQESSALIWASQQNRPQLVASLLSDHSANVDTTDARFRTPIYHAIRASHDEVVKLLFEHDADIDWRDDRGQTPLLFALQRGYLDMARLLLHNFLPSVNEKDFRGRNAIWYAVDQGCPELVQVLLNHACDIWISDVRRITPLKNDLENSFPAKTFS
jgi:ankyrin repeat protein